MKDVMKKHSPLYSPQEAYQQRLEAGILLPDAAHLALILVLQRLYESLMASVASESNKRSHQWHHKLKPAVIKQFFAPSSPVCENLYIWGEVGRGKSMLMDLFCACLPADFPYQRVHYHAFMADIHHRLHTQRQNGKDTADALAPIARDTAIRLKLLCLDEFQVQDIADAMILSRLFSLLLDAGLTVITTSNRPPQDLYKNGLQREYFLKFIDLVKQRFSICELQSPTDYRLQKAQDAPRYFFPLTPENAAQIEQRFAALQTTSVAPLTLYVNDRALVLPHTAQSIAQRIAWCSFDELCRTPLGAEDYAAIAEHFHTLFLVDIPALTREDRNEAKRFVTLIDTLYEYKTEVIFLAATAPEGLYSMGDGNFEFQRTVSRIHEMQSVGGKR
jgi:cell division protein ZapE